MAINCQCSSCGASLRVSDKLAGQTGKCPKCSGKVVVPAVGKPGDVPEADPTAAPPPPPLAEADRGLPSIDTGEDAGSMVARRGIRRSGQPASSKWWWAAGGATVAILAVGIGLAFYLLAGGKPPGPQPPAAGQPKSVLVLDWPEDQRRGGGVSIDGRERELPESGEISFTLEPGPHKITMMRRGYEQVEESVDLEPGGRRPYRPQWKPLAVALSNPDDPPPEGTFSPTVDTPPELTENRPMDSWPDLVAGFDHWLQDFDAAKRQAAEQGKSILVFFNGSDWSAPCRYLAAEVLLEAEFKRRAERDFVLVHLDFPRLPEAQTRVEDPQRNARLKARFKVSDFPTVALADETGRPVGAVEGYAPGKAEEYLESLNHLQALRRQLAQRSETPPESDAPPESPPGPETPPEPQITLTDEDLNDPEAAIAKLKLRPQSGYLSLPGDVEFRTTMRGIEPLRRKAFQTQQEAAAAEQTVEQKQQLILTYLQQRRELRAQLARTVSLARHAELVTALNELADRINLMQESDREEEAAKQARATANQAAEQYIEQVLAARGLQTRVAEKYADLAADARVETAVEKYSELKSSKHRLGPTTSFLTEARQLEKLEDTILAEEIDLRRGGGNLWHVSVVFNGRFAQEMAIDTGASVIALPWKVAQSAGLTPTVNDPAMRLQMADGRIVEGRKVIAKTVRVGKFTVENVKCAVMPPEFTEADPLLGLSFLKNFTFQIDNARGKLIMSKINVPEPKR